MPRLPSCRRTRGSPLSSRAHPFGDEGKQDLRRDERCGGSGCTQTLSSTSIFRAVVAGARYFTAGPRCVPPAHTSPHRPVLPIDDPEVVLAVDGETTKAVPCSRGSSARTFAMQAPAATCEAPVGGYDGCTWLCASGVSSSLWRQGLCAGGAWSPLLAGRVRRPPTPAHAPMDGHGGGTCAPTQTLRSRARDALPALPAIDRHSDALQQTLPRRPGPWTTDAAWTATASRADGREDKGRWTRDDCTVPSESLRPTASPRAHSGNGIFKTRFAPSSPLLSPLHTRPPITLRLHYGHLHPARPPREYMIKLLLWMRDGDARALA
ncbi:hypothetical protein DFH06DRAFT_1332397 [Mycena polygramma]|nr:hypothetical protein DFH06DRAFT_1332397 [Mycena polygramma]